MKSSALKYRLRAGIGTAALILALCGGASATAMISSATFDGSDSGNDRSQGLGLDAGGNVYAGGVVTQGGNEDIWIGKYDPDLVLVASASWAGSAGNNDAAFGPVVGADGSIYVPGYINESAGGINAWVGKVDASLVLKSSVSVNGSIGAFDFFTGIALDQNGDVIVTGFLHETVGGINAWIGKFDADLVLLASTSFDAAGSGDWAVAADLDSGGNIVVAGQSDPGTGNTDAWLAKFDSSLNFISSVTVAGSAGSGNDFAVAVDVDSGGNILVAGYLDELTGGQNAWLASYDASLVLQSSLTYNGSGGGSDKFLGLFRSAGGKIFLSGQVDETAGGENLWVAKYDSSFVLESSGTIDGSSVGSDAGYGIRPDAGGNLFAAGVLDEAVGGGNIAVVKFSLAASSSVSAGGATLTYDMPGGEATLAIPAGTFASAAAVLFQGPTALAAVGPGSLSMNATGVAVAITVTPAFQPAGFVNLTIPYRDEDVSGREEGRLIIARYDETAGVWVPLYSTVDAANNTVSALTDHFSVFQIMEVVAADSVSNVRVFPNPFRPGSGHSSVTFLNIPAFSRIRVFTMAGEKVIDLTANGAGVAAWDARSQAGTLLASGVYYGYVQSGASLRKTFKVAIER